MTTPTPQEAADLLSHIDSARSRARVHDSWPLVTMLFVLSAGLSVGLIGIGVVEDSTSGLLILGAGLAWLVPALVVYLVTALSWSSRSTFLLATWLPIVVLAFLVGALGDSFAPGSWLPFGAAALIWVAAPVLALVGLRR
ncbi:hypothetical protein DFO66_11051 [Brevibacterium sanguinis]|uniref:Uncharacterized protein n=2 Tax=Brevibacterium TaxID=1696 RepID=A0A366IHE4_9MICO|nr:MULTISPECIES: hypothetical protein [Brevibacterium]RBP63428.1 hypothetical protein DFO66_11051 [Brevibacterium sanguinis]RBP69895.1 hypothetical protein DFO65_11051 [Brevibacterium celere]